MINLKLLAATMREWSDTSGDHHMLAADAIEKLIVVQAELAAQVEALRSIGQRLWDSPESTNRQDVEAEADLWLGLKRLLTATPQQHLAEIKIPTNAEEASGMALIGMSWLENNAPEKLTELHRESMAQAVLEFTESAINILSENEEIQVSSGRGSDAVDIEIANVVKSSELHQFAKQYADSIRRGGVE